MPDPAEFPPSYTGAPPPTRPRERNVVLIALLIVGGGFVAMVALIAVIFGFAWRATAGPAGAADKFLATTAAEGPQAAWRTGSRAMQQSGSEAEWDTFARRNALTTYRASHWGSRRVENGGGSVSGTVDTASGAVPLTIEAVKSGDGWRVQRVTGAPAGFATDAAAGTITTNVSSDF